MQTVTNISILSRSKLLFLERPRQQFDVARHVELSFHAHVGAVKRQRNRGVSSLRKDEPSLTLVVIGFFMIPDFVHHPDAPDVFSWLLPAGVWPCTLDEIERKLAEDFTLSRIQWIGILLRPLFLHLASIGRQLQRWHQYGPEREVDHAQRGGHLHPDADGGRPKPGQPASLRKRHPQRQYQPQQLR